MVNRIDTVKLTATKNDDNAMVVITNDDDRPARAGEAMLDLSVGSNTLTVTVTAQDGTATLTYTVTVDRLAVSTTGSHGTQRLGPDSLRSRHRRPVPADVPLLDRYRRHVRRHRGLQHLHPEPRRSRPRADVKTTERVSGGGLHAAVNARNNTGTNTNTTGAGVPIYWLNGNEVADDYADFYDGSWDDEANDKDESGNNGPNTSLEVNYPFTGCSTTTARRRFYTVTSSRALGAVKCASAVPTLHGSSTDGPLGSTTCHDQQRTRPMYGLSQVFEVPIPTISYGQQHASDFDGRQQLGYEAQSFETGTNARRLHGLRGLIYG